MSVYDPQLTPLAKWLAEYESRRRLYGELNADKWADRVPRPDDPR